MPVVGIDCRFAALPVGIGRYTRELVSILAKRNDPWTYVLFTAPGKTDWIPQSDRITVRTVSATHYSFIEHFLLPRELRRAKVDLLWSPQFNVPFLCPVPYVVTIHDLILHEFPNQASFWKRAAYKLLMRHAIKARDILTVSNTTKNDLLRAYGFDLQHHIHVAHPGIDACFTPAAAADIERVRSVYKLPANYFLYVGSAKEHKNVQTLIDAFEHISNGQEHLVLVLYGEEAKRLQLGAHCIAIHSIPDADLPPLYSGAIAFASATKYEGFGLPFLEAMACKCPVLGTDIPALREVCKNHALLVPPTFEALILGFEAVRKRDEHTVNAAYEHARTFRWEKTAETVASVLGTKLG